MKTITQTAAELNVSRTKIYSEIKNLGIETEKEGKNNYLNEDDFKRIKLRIEEQNNSSKERLKNVLERDRDMIGNNITDREYTDLKERIAFLESQLVAKDEQLNTKDKQINAKDYQLNGLIQSNFNLSKSLPPSKEVDSEDSVENEAVATEEKSNEQKKSWFRKIFKKNKHV